MSVNNLTTVGNAPAVDPINLEATGQTVTQTATQTRQSEGGQASDGSQAVLVALEDFATTELDALARTIATRTTLVGKLPPELKELVQKIFSQSQTMQTALPAGLVALLKSPKTVSEKLGLLATMLEEAAGAGTKAGEQANEKVFGKQQILLECVNAWRDRDPDKLKAAAKALRELATAMSKAGNQTPAGQDLPVTILQSGEVATRQLETSTSDLRTGRLAAGQPETSVATAQSDQVVVAKQDMPTTTSQPGTAANKQQDPLLVLSQSDGANSGPQAAAGPAAKALKDPDTTDSWLQSSVNHSEDGAVTADKPSSLNTETKNPAAARLVSDTQQDNTVGKRQTASNLAFQAGGEMPEQAEQAVLAKLFTGRPELIKNVPPEIKELIQIILRQAGSKPATTDWQEPLAALIKSPQPTAGKLTMFATILEEAAELLRPEAKFAMQTAAGGQQVLAEAINAWRNKNQEEVKAAAKTIRELTEIMSKPDGVLAERQAGHSLLTFTVPLYFGDGQTAYPAHIHVYYQEEDDKKNPGQQVTEIWLRICLETENIGTVETAFRLYDGQSLDVKVRFNDSEVADSFTDSVPAVKEQLGQLPFNLGEFLVK